MILNDDEIRFVQQTLKSAIRVKYYKWCRSLGWTKRDILEWAESVSGEGISRGLDEIDRWDPERGSMTCWFYLRTCTVARDELRALSAQKRREPKYQRSVTEEDHEAYNPFEALHDKYTLVEILENLKPVQREVLVYYEYIGLKVPEISLILQCPAKTVYTHLARARKKASLFRNNTEGGQKRKRASKSEGADSQKDEAGPHSPRPPPPYKSSPPSL